MHMNCHLGARLSRQPLDWIPSLRVWYYVGLVRKHGWSRLWTQHLQAIKVPCIVCESQFSFQPPPAASTVSEAGYPGTIGFRKVVKATGIMTRTKSEINDEDFIKCYNEKHPHAAAPVLMEHKIIYCSLTYRLGRDCKKMQDTSKGRANLLDYDAICTFNFPDYLSLAKFLSGPMAKL
ncbi:uncharacterized protein PV09_02273 [Verruconis gallopava]|uniref:EthD domain-containing protein n=1 Tax=Verruconis gallopava TaxID=253628 RepID=A0A0D2AKV7_9PEZI|nr:uncharacterized protein PV09_02273 [Verruconis gallopava]KIW07433.1 hypothetical protein PV09_02273 [Verruconis gallopava]